MGEQQQCHVMAIEVLRRKSLPLGVIGIFGCDDFLISRVERDET